MVLPITTIILIGVHFWRIRKSDGLAIPAGADELVLASQGITGPAPVAEARLRREQTVLSWPTAFWAEGAVFLGAMAALLLAAILVDAPLLAPADISVPENPAKSPWYFLGVQELVSYSAFTGGVLVPLILLLAATAVPYVDREENGIGRWFGGRRGRGIVLQSALLSLGLTIGVMSIAIVGGWHWTRNAPAAVALIANPGAILAAVYGLWSWRVLRVTTSTKLGVFALAACSLTGGILITIVGIWLRGPNWEFMW